MSKTTQKKKTVRKKYTVLEPFIDRDGTPYATGDEYSGKEDRIKALLTEEVSPLNWEGRIFLEEK